MQYSGIGQEEEAQILGTPTPIETVLTCDRWRCGSPAMGQCRGCQDHYCSHHGKDGYCWACAPIKKQGKTFRLLVKK